MPDCNGLRSSLLCHILIITSGPRVTLNDLTIAPISDAECLSAFNPAGAYPASR